MPDIFTPIIEKLMELGFFKFLLPYMLTSAIFYGLLRKTQIFGDPEKNTAVNATVATVAALMAMAAPIITGIDIQTQLSAFFMQAMSVSLIFIVSIMIAGMFLPPNLPELLEKKLKSWSAALLIIGMASGVFVFLMSGLFSMLFGRIILSIPSDVLWMIVGAILLILPIILIVGIGGGGNKKQGG